MSPTALRLRGIHPRRSVWCEIQDHRRILCPYATLVPEKQAVAHAVAHDLSRTQFTEVEKFEPPSQAVRVLLRRGPEARVLL